MSLKFTVINCDGAKKDYQYADFPAMVTDIDTLDENRAWEIPMLDDSVENISFFDRPLKKYPSFRNSDPKTVKDLYLIGIGVVYLKKQRPEVQPVSIIRKDGSSFSMTMKPSTLEIKEELEKMIEEDWDSLKEQIRAMFTAMCVINDWQADTYNVDNYLMYLYVKGNIESLGIRFDNAENDFYDYMVALII